MSLTFSRQVEETELKCTCMWKHSALEDSYNLRALWGEGRGGEEEQMVDRRRERERERQGDRKGGNTGFE